MHITSNTAPFPTIIYKKEFVKDQEKLARKHFYAKT